MDEDNVSMTIRLQNGKTRFLPFNRGRDGGAGIPSATSPLFFTFHLDNKWTVKYTCANISLQDVIRSCGINGKLKSEIRSCRKLGQAVDRSSYLAVVLSPESVSSPWVRVELGSALMKHLSTERSI